MIHDWGERWIWRKEHSEECADENGQMAIQDQGDVWTWAMTRGQVIIGSSGAATGACVDV